MLLQNTILQQPSTSPIQNQVGDNLEVKSPHVIAMPMDVIGSMLSVPVNALRMPRSLLNTAIDVSKLGQKLARNEWCCYPVLVHNSWGYIPSFI